MGTAIGKLEEKVKLLKEELELRRVQGPTPAVQDNSDVVHRLEEELQNTTKKMEKALNELGPLGFKEKKLSKKVKQLEQELVVVSNTLNREQILRENVENKLVSSQKRFKALQKNLSMVREENTNLTNDLESSAILQSQLQSSEETIHALREELMEKEKRIKYLDAHKITEHMKTKFKNMQKKYEKSKSDCSILKEKCLQLKKKLDKVMTGGREGERGGSGGTNDKMVRLLQDKLRKYLDLNRALKDEKDAICKLDYIKDLVSKKKLPLPDALRQLVKALKVAATKQKKLGGGAREKELAKLQAKFVELKRAHDEVQLKLSEKAAKVVSLTEMYESVKGEKNEMKSVGAQRLSEYKREISNGKAQIVALREKLDDAERVHERAEQAHKESVRFLEKENLQLLLEVKKLKSAVDVVTKNRQGGTTRAEDAPAESGTVESGETTEDLTNFVLQSGSNEECDKENARNGTRGRAMRGLGGKTARSKVSSAKKRTDKRESLASLNDISIENFTDGMTGTIIAGGDDFDDEELRVYATVVWKATVYVLY